MATQKLDTFGERLRHVRIKRGLLRLDLALLLQQDRSRMSVARWEQDRVYPNCENLKRLSLALDVSVDWLLFGNEVPRE